MRRNLRIRWWARCLAHLIPLIALLSLTPASPVQASGMGISGTFSSQHFQLIPGEEVSTPDIYIVVFNNTDNDVLVKLIPQTPFGVELILPEADFLLPSGSQKKTEVGVTVDLEAVPGEYTLTLTAQAGTKGDGIKLAAAAQQQAKITIFGEAGSLVFSTITPQGNPFPATLKLYREAEGRSFPCGYSETGKLETRLAPGDYLAQAYFQGIKVAEERFSLVADEQKDITLVAATVFLEGFSVLPNYQSKNGELAFAKIVYTINNIYQPLDDVKAILKVTIDGQTVEKTDLISLPTLNVGKTAGNSNYIPTEGWQDTIYSFKIELYSQGKLYTQSSVQEMAAESVGGVSTAINWTLIFGIVGIMVIAIILLVAILRRRRLVCNK